MGQWGNVAMVIASSGQHCASGLAPLPSDRLISAGVPVPGWAELPRPHGMALPARRRVLVPSPRASTGCAVDRARPSRTQPPFGISTSSTTIPFMPVATWRFGSTASGPGDALAIACRAAADARRRFALRSARPSAQGRHRRSWAKQRDAPAPCGLSRSTPESEEASADTCGRSRGSIRHATRGNRRTRSVYCGYDRRDRDDRDEYLVRRRDDRCLSSLDDGAGRRLAAADRMDGSPEVQDSAPAGRHGQREDRDLSAVGGGGDRCRPSRPGARA